MLSERPGEREHRTVHAACGVIGLAFPQVLFFGYSTLNAILEAGDAPGATESLDVLGNLATTLSGGVVQSEGFGRENLLGLLAAKLLARLLARASLPPREAAAWPRPSRTFALSDECARARALTKQCST